MEIRLQLVTHDFQDSNKCLDPLKIFKYLVVRKYIKQVNIDFHWSAKLSKNNLTAGVFPVWF